MTCCVAPSTSHSHTAAHATASPLSCTTRRGRRSPTRRWHRERKPRTRTFRRSKNEPTSLAPAVMQHEQPLVLVIMGPSGCGKSSVGRRTAEIAGCPFLEGDEFHPESNILKMSKGEPLTDEDRKPWLAALRAAMEPALGSATRCVVSCSALKREYRAQLTTDSSHGSGNSANGVGFVLLEPSRQELKLRMSSRQGHFMPSSLLDSQLATLSYTDDELYMHFRSDSEAGSGFPTADEIAAAVVRRWNSHTPTDHNTPAPDGHARRTSAVARDTRRL